MTHRWKDYDLAKRLGQFGSILSDPRNDFGATLGKHDTIGRVK